MPKLTMSIPHQHTQEETGERMKKLLGRVMEKYKDSIKDLKEEWVGNAVNFSIKAMGFSFKGTASVEPTEVKIDGDLPFAAMMFKGQIDKAVREAVEKYMA